MNPELFPAFNLPFIYIFNTDYKLVPIDNVHCCLGAESSVFFIALSCAAVKKYAYHPVKS